MEETDQALQRLAEAILSHRPRETSGSTSTNRFNFQRTWALCQWLRLHESQRDYVLLMEFHDDVVVLEGSAEPLSVEFYQVKTRKDGHWSVKNLLAVSAKAAKGSHPDLFGTTGKGTAKLKGIPGSILGKLLEHCQHFLPYLRSLNLVSNVSFKIPLANNTPPSTERDHFNLAEVAAGVRSEFTSAARTELALPSPPPWDKINFVVTGISLTEHETHGAGELAGFLERKRPGGRFPVQPLYRTLCGELSRRAANEWQPASFEDLFKKKGVCRRDLDDFLAAAGGLTDPEEQLQRATSQLSLEGLGFRDTVVVENSWRRYCIDRMNYANLVVQALRERAANVVTQVVSSPDWHTLRDFLELALAEFNRRHGPPEYPLDNNYLMGAMLYEFEIYRARQLPPTSSQHETETV